MQRFLVITALFLLCCINYSTASADVLLIEAVKASHNNTLPENGITMSAVESRWGEPVSKHGAVGQPPITRWQYADYSVYFEHDRVLTSVIHQPFANR